MECNICDRGTAELVGLGYENGDTYEMYLCEECRLRFVSDDTVRSVNRLQTP